jgi:hypothetical protein
MTKSSVAFSVGFHVFQLISDTLRGTEIISPTIYLLWHERVMRNHKFVALACARVYNDPDEYHSSLKGIVRSRGLPMEVEGLSMRAT